MKRYCLREVINKQKTCSGYSDEFKKIGENYGPFDIAFVENGAYNRAWSEIHMFPEQSV